MLEWLYPIRDRLLSNAAVAEGDVVLDVGCGDGLVAFAAIERVGPTGRVIFSDVSQDLIDHARALATQMGVLERCDFVRAAAEDLGEIRDGSVDVVTTRSVLIYVAEKERAFREFHRVLRPGGRVSIYEPVNRFNEPRSPEISYEGFDMTPVLEIYAKIRDFYRGLQPPDSDPMLDFDERDLIEIADRTGFRQVRLEYYAEIAPPKEARRWEVAIRGAWNPKVPSLEVAMGQLLTPEELERYTNHMRPLYESGAGRARSAHAYLLATK
jgi:ubiquinone/menaquinone biosynthesis C-methylase UbiE